MSCVITTHNLSFYYMKEVQALLDVSFSVHQGEKVGIIGPSGAGKTTLFWHLNGLFKPNSGEIKIFEKPLTSLKDINEVRRHIALTFQQVNDQLFCSSVYDEIAFGPRNLGWQKHDINEAVEKWLAYFELNNVRLRPPLHLSGGQKRRVALAAALAMEPDLLILDEPANDLDHLHRRKLIAYLKDLKIALLVASHDLRLINELTERCIIMDKGRLVEDKPTIDLIYNEAVLKQYGMEAIK